MRNEKVHGRELEQQQNMRKELKSALVRFLFLSLLCWFSSFLLPTSYAFSFSLNDDDDGGVGEKKDLVTLFFLLFRSNYILDTVNIVRSLAFVLFKCTVAKKEKMKEIFLILCLVRFGLERKEKLYVRERESCELELCCVRVAGVRTGGKNKPTVFFSFF